MVLLAAGASVVPAANRRFHVSEYAASVNEPQAASARRLPPAPSDLGPLSLVAAAADRPLGPYGGVLLFRTGLAWLGAVLVLLGSSIAPLGPRRRRGWTIGVASAYGVCFALFPSTWEFGGHALAFVGLVPWLLLAAALTSAVSLRRAVIVESQSRSLA